MKVVKDKGGWRTEPHIQIDLGRARREARDAIHGNVPFHVDPFAKPAAPAPAAEPEPVQVCFCAFVGGICDSCAGPKDTPLSRLHAELVAPMVKALQAQVDRACNPPVDHLGRPIRDA